MSRMLGFFSSTPISVPQAIGDTTFADFARLSHVHADGWGIGRLQCGVVTATGGTEEFSRSSGIHAQVAQPGSAAILYLRFASAGAPPSPENTQPFLRDGLAFQHNGLLAPREHAWELLTAAERTSLRGQTDSEIYSLLAARALVGASAPSEKLSRLAEEVRRLRTVFPHACLNAMGLTDEGIYVVHSAGDSAPPHESFRRRGFSISDLPPGHGVDYNQLRTTTTPAGTRIVATTGFAQDGWEDLPADAVIFVTAGRPLTVQV